MLPLGQLVSKTGPSIWAAGQMPALFVLRATTHFFVILLSDFMPGAHIHKINHLADPIRDAIGPWKVKACRYTPETRAVRKFLSICLACLSIDGDLSIKSRPREAAA